MAPPKRGGSKTQRTVGMCVECAEVVEVQRVVYVGARSAKVWLCKGKGHEAVDPRSVTNVVGS